MARIIAGAAGKAALFQVASLHDHVGIHRVGLLVEVIDGQFTGARQAASNDLLSDFSGYSWSCVGFGLFAGY